MKGSKIIATMVVLAMLLSTLVVFNQLNIVKEASATPGVDDWGYATTDLEYGVAYTTVTINTSTWPITNGTPYYLYYPTYLNTGAGPNADTFTWDGPFKAGVSAYVNTKSKNEILEPSGTAITFNRSGMWIFDDDTDHSMGGYAGYIWVNGSNVYSVQSIADIKYGDSGSLTVTVNTESDTGCMIDIIRPDNTTMYHKWRSTGISEAIKIEPANFTLAGDYTVKAYRDFDLQDEMYLYSDEGGAAYDENYGSGITAIGYSYAEVGPWDPPEKMADEETFTVNTGKPNIVLSNTTFYWGFEARIDINVTDNDGAGIDTMMNPIVLKFGSKYIDFSTYITNEGNGNYSIQIPRFDAGNGWSDLATALGNNNVNGTWRIYFGYDDNADDVYEWNNSATFIVRSANPPVQITIVNDGSGTSTDKKVDVPAYLGGGVAPTIAIQFDIFGTSISNEYGRAYYGDDAPENADNITVSGDLLYPVDAVYTGPDGRWIADVTPTKPGGTITIEIDWPGDDNGSASVDIEIVNGTFVTPAVESFTVGDDYNLTVTVTDMDGAAVKNAQVYLMWEDVPYQFNSTTGNNQPGKGYNGEYTFWIPPHEDESTTPASAPQNITIAARWYEGFWGYTKVIMERDHNMRVNITPTTGYAGDSVEYDIIVSLIGGGHPDDTGLSVALFNETGEYVTGIDEWYVNGDYDILDELIILSGGTYYIAAMNATSDSRGNNATLIITNYTVTCSPSTLAWVIDDDVNMTFQVMPVGNGTLTIYNMSAASEASELGSTTQVAIESGIGTLDDVAATTLGNVTFSYTPDGGEDRHADGLLRVTTATATPIPARIYNGEPTLVTITITHPATGEPLEDVRVGLDHGVPLNESILAKLPSDQFTDADGIVEFSITAEASGNVTIYMENETDPDNAFVIISTARKPMTVSNEPSVDEGKTFTVTAQYNGVAITDTTVTFTFNGQTWPTTTGVATLTAPSVPASLSYPITATAEGYVTVSTSIMVLNVPKLTIIPPTDKVAGKQKFLVTIANDEGTGVSGASVEFNGEKVLSGVNGETWLTAPDVKEDYQDYDIKATFTGYADADPVTIRIAKTPGVPGFELLTLLAAIGVAFLLLRRRRK